MGDALKKRTCEGLQLGISYLERRILLKFEESARGANLPSHGGELNTSESPGGKGQRRRGISSSDRVQTGLILA